MKASIKVLESSVHTYLAEVASRVYSIRDHIANSDFDEADVESAALMADLFVQLRQLDFDEGAAAAPGKPRAGFVLEFDPLVEGPTTGQLRKVG